MITNKQIGIGLLATVAGATAVTLYLRGKKDVNLVNTLEIEPAAEPLVKNYAERKSRTNLTEESIANKVAWVG